MRYGRKLGVCIAALCFGGVTTAARGAAVTGAADGAAQAQAKILSIQGHVESARAETEAWAAAQLFQGLFVSDRVRTLTASRASVLFIDETQVKLNAGAVLTVQAVRKGSGEPTTLTLLEGEGWFRTKNPASGLTVKTPSAAAAIRGTEINVSLDPGDVTVLTVVEGAAEFSNAQGSLRVSAGEEATARPGQAPTKRVVLDPENAVQWALYYPASVAWHDLPPSASQGAARAGFEHLRAGDPAAAIEAFRATLATDGWSRIGTSIAHIELGQIEDAKAVLSMQPAGAASDRAKDEQAGQHAQLAAVALAAGDAGTARAEIDAALAIDPGAPRPLALLSSLELTQNRAERASSAAAKALAAHPDSVGANIAAGEAAQAVFDLRAALRFFDQAVGLDPADVRALIDRARVRFGTGDTRGAREDVERASSVAPMDAQVRSLSGFIKLAGGAVDEARAEFEAAAAADTEFGEPHLGLGLVRFREKREEDGLLEMLTATLLEPKVSLYQSYLGKAYYQVQRFPEGLSALASAKRLDPRDPTPWLYSSFFLRDQNRQVTALEELRHAIALNDNRAVYRGRLLLDRDLATKNVSLAQLYRQLGFDAWGAYEALNSLGADLTNSSAHLFLAETYGNLPDRVKAQGSELLQYFLYAPVNRNAFNAFNEYTALLEQPRKQVGLLLEAGEDTLASGDVNSLGGNESFAYSTFILGTRVDGARPHDPDVTKQGFGQMKLSLGSNTDMFVSANGFRSERGQRPDAVVTVGVNQGTPVLITQFTKTRDPDEVTKNTDLVGTLGFKHDWGGGSSFTAAFQIQRPETRTDDVDGMALGVSGLVEASDVRFNERSYDVQVQQATRLGNHQVVTGSEFARTLDVFDSDSQFTFGATGPLAARSTDHTESRNKVFGGWLQDEIELPPRVHATVGVRYDDARVEESDESVFSVFVQPPMTDRQVKAGVSNFQQWSPLAGVSVRLFTATVLRAAAFRRLNTDLFGSRISPSTVAGFVLDRNELSNADRREAGVSLETEHARTFASIRAFYRRTELPLLAITPVSATDRTSRASGASAYFDWILSRRWSLFADDQFVRTGTNVFVHRDNEVRAGVNFIHERGFFARVATSWIAQHFYDTDIPELTDSGYSLTDLSFNYEFARKRARATLEVTNLFDRSFTSFVEGLSVGLPSPERRAIGRFSYRF